MKTWLIIMLVMGSCLSGFSHSCGYVVQPETIISRYPVYPEKVIDVPDLSVSKDFDPDQFCADVRDALYFEHTWVVGISLGLDWFNPPSDLVTAKLSAVSAMTAEGQDVSDHVKMGSFKVDRVRREARISLFRQRDKPEPVKVSFTLNFDVPTKIDTITLTKANPVHQNGEAGIHLVVISNSLVCVRSEKMSLKGAKIYALNSDGDYLCGSVDSVPPSSYIGVFQGTPERVQVVIPVETKNCSVEIIDFPVTKESKPVMPREPTDAVPVRYSLLPVREFVSPDVETMASTLNAISVSVTPHGWWLRISAPPANVKMNKLEVRTYLAGIKELVHAGQDSCQRSASGRGYACQLGNTNILNKAAAIFGDLHARLCDEVKTYTANLSSEMTPLIAGLESVKVSVEHNVVWFNYDGDFQVLSVQAFDQTGRRLKKDFRTSSRQQSRGYHFWGQPVKVTATCSLSTTNVVVPFAVELKEGGLEKVAAVRRKADQFETLLEELTAIQKEARRYGNLLAASYYAANHRGESVAKIPQEVAQADPAGAEIFGYELKPYKGYVLKKIPSDYEAKRDQKPQSHKWSGGEFEALSYNGHLLAVPAEKGDPAILVQWSGTAFVNYGDVSEFEAAPSSQRDLEKEGWIKVK